jgi:Di-haem cytochrome c peroxidase
MSCAGCHLPSAAFVDHRQHEVGSGGLFKTPTLLNADFNAPYFHDGRFDTFDQVIAHFNRLYDLKLSEQDSADLNAFLTAVGDGVRPEYHLTGANTLEDINGFASVLDIALSRHDTPVVAFTVKSVNDLLRDLADHYAETAPSLDSSGAQQRALARANIGAMLKILQRLNSAVSHDRYADAAREYLNYRKLTFASAPLALAAADPWSTFNPERRAVRHAPLSSIVRSDVQLQ